MGLLAAVCEHVPMRGTTSDALLTSLFPGLPGVTQ